MALRHLFATVAIASSLLGATASQAAVNLYEDFESYVEGTPGNGPLYGDSELNFTNFTKGFNVQAGSGTVDIIGATDPWNLMTGYGSGFLDLDGSTNDGGVMRTANYNFQAGNVVTLTFEASGNQRGGTDEWSFGFETAGGAISFLNVKVLNDPFFNPATGVQSLGDLGSGPALASGVAALNSGDPWRQYSISFTAGNAGSLSAFIGTSSADNIGVLLDSVSFSITPEPQTWAMMLMGFGAVGAMVRRRRLVPAIA